ncbi:hypothetical protein [Nannocystis pusilla]|uniref:hypothetical protein n=1 Tax=Nannocystis pusilla TaxID=889268 RepID=UPI003DA28FE7
MTISAVRDFFSDLPGDKSFTTRSIAFTGETIDVISLPGAAAFPWTSGLASALGKGDDRIRLEKESRDRAGARLQDPLGGWLQ